MIKLSFCCRVLKFINPMAMRKMSTTPRNCVVARVSELGRFSRPLPPDAQYTPGQLFVHRVLGYRGVVLLPRRVRVYDKSAPLSATGSTRSEEDYQKEMEEKNEKIENKAVVDCLKDIIKKNGTSTVETYYQVLVDKRDANFLETNQTRVESVPRAQEADWEEHPLDVMGMDYLSHEDVLPFETNQSRPLHHPNMPQLFKRRRDPNGSTVFSPHTALLLLQDHSHHWLHLADVYKQVTEEVRVTVMPFYMGKNLTLESTESYWWRYIIRLENLSSSPVQLLMRSWRIFSQSGTLETRKGRGVVGLQPVLTPENPAFQYTSHAPLMCSSGHMWGNYRMEREDGSNFDVRIPPFSLESKCDRDGDC